MNNKELEHRLIELSTHIPDITTYEIIKHFETIKNQVSSRAGEHPQMDEKIIEYMERYYKRLYKNELH